MFDKSMILTVDASKPIIFELPGFKNDVRFTVLGQEFHTHSVQLKISSAFFRKFLDSPEKEGKVTGTLFKHEWKSRIEDTGESWTLVSSFPPTGTTKEVEAEPLMDDTKAWNNRRSFYKLLLALYGRPYVLGELEEFEQLVALADYYCALPAVSRTLGTSLMDSPYLVSNLETDVSQFLPLATKLHHRGLFVECVIWLCSEWDGDLSFLKITQLFEDPKLKTVLKRSHKDILSRIGDAHECIRKWEIKTANIFQVQEAKRIRSSDLCLTEYLRQMESLAGTSLKGRSVIAKVLQNSLSLNYSYRSSELKPMKDLVLSAEVEDEDLPWDINQIDW